MRANSLPLTAKQLFSMLYNTKTLSFDFPIQRPSGVWSDYNKSLIINSGVNGYIIPPVYFYKEATGNFDSKKRPISIHHVVDGVQRLSSWLGYMNDEFAYSKDAPALEIDGEDHDISGKKYSELTDDEKDAIKNFSFSCYDLSECSEEEISELFFRLNNGVALTKTQKSKALIGVENAKFLNEILERDFYKNVCHFTASQLKQGADQCTLLQAMMLIDVEDGVYDEPKSISEAELMTYAERINNNYSEDQKDMIRSIVDYLEKAFTTKEKFLKKINIPMVFLMVKRAMDVNFEAENFSGWITEFSMNCEEYKKYCSAGSVKKANVHGRIDELKKSMDEYINYINNYFGDGV